VLRGAVTDDGTGVRSFVWPYPAFEMFRAEEGVFASVLGRQPVNGLVVDGGEGGLADGTYVTGEYFQTLGVRVVAGRTLTADDDRAGAPPAIVLSAAFSRERFGSADAAIGRSIRLDNVSFTVVGVAPSEFFGLDPARSPDLFIPVRCFNRNSAPIDVLSCASLPATRSSRSRSASASACSPAPL
jgi:hypothetical protein